MNIMRMPPFVRLSLGLIALTLSVLFMGELIGFVPDKSKSMLDARKKLSESLAVQYTLAANRGDFSQIETSLGILVERNPDVLSAAMRKADGTLFAVAGDHKRLWRASSDGKSSPTHVRVPILQNGESWGGVEVRFASLQGSNIWYTMQNSFWGMLVFVAVSGFFGYLLFMKRALRELDPSQVIPERVKAAFDSLAEGVLILDEKEQVVLANRAFSEHVGLNFDNLIGKKASGLGWKLASFEQLGDEWVYPWTVALQKGESQTGVRLRLIADGKRENTFMVNCSPIDSDGVTRGVLTTFDDVTQLEMKNVELQAMLDKLEESQNEIERQNDQLKLLAEHDSLTGCYNRRALHARFNEQFDTARDQDLHLACIMVDIDHFKSINDNFGHQTGDRVIKLVADILRENLRENDMVGRYGGEEFCLVLPGIEPAAVMEIAERIRVSIMDSSEYRLSGGKRVTASLGVASIKDGAKDSGELVNQADKALYFAKNSGRNRVILWSDWLGDDDEATKVTSNVVQLMPEAQNEGQPSEQSADAPETSINELHVRIKELEDLSEEQMKTLERRLNYDPVTGLPSRILFHDRLQTALARAKRRGDTVGLLSISATTFRRIHDTLGSDEADRLIVEVSRKLSNVLRDTDTVSIRSSSSSHDPLLSRHNSDDFYLLVPELKQKEDITRIVNRIYDTFSQPLNVSGYNIQINNCIGVSMFPMDGEDADLLLKHADVARHHAKETPGSNNCQFYSDDMNELFAAQLETESELIRALEYNEFELYYQPLLNTKHGHIRKLEALLRWNHPEKGVLSAAGFIGIAEGSGLINRIGDWVLRSAIRQLALWRRELSPELMVSVNLSALQLQQKNIAAKILGYLEENNVPPQNLELEITESTVMENFDRAMDIIDTLHSSGMRIAIDDFGTGYSSLQHLQKFPIDVLKIDRSFVKDIDSGNNDITIVTAVINMARQIGLTTVAEGVENENQFKILRQLDCDEVQGYLFSRPVPVKQAHEMLERQESHREQSRVWLAS